MSGLVNTIKEALTDIADIEERAAGGVGNLTGDALVALDYLRVDIDRLNALNTRLLEALQEAASALEAVAEITWDKRHPDATRTACDEASSIANEGCEAARAVVVKATTP